MKDSKRFLAKLLWDIQSENNVTPHWDLDSFYLELAGGASELFLWPDDLSPEGFVLYRQVLNEVTIMNLSVRTKGQGLGQKLLRSFLDRWEKSGESFVESVFLEVSENNIPAVKLYRAMGFSDVGNRAAYYKDGSTAIVMKWKPRTPS